MALSNGIPGSVSLATSRKTISIAVTLASLVSLSCGDGSEITPQISVFDELLSELVDDLPLSYVAKRAPLTLYWSNQVTVNDCASFHEVIRRDRSNTFDYEHRGSYNGTYWRCTVLLLIAWGGTPTRTWCDAPDPMDCVAGQLDLSETRSWFGPGERRNTIDIEISHHSQVERSAHHIGFLEERVDRTQVFDFDLIAAGEFTGDGVQDLVVRMHESLYHTTLLWLVTINDAGGVISMDVEDVLGLPPVEY